jgi:hypothetical protein
MMSDDNPWFVHLGFSLPDLHLAQCHGASERAAELRPNLRPILVWEPLSIIHKYTQ